MTVIPCRTVDQTGVRREALAADQPLCDAPPHGRLEQQAKQDAIPETAVPVLGKAEVIRYAVGQIQTAEPTLCEVQVHFLAKPPPNRTPKQ